MKKQPILTVSDHLVIEERIDSYWVNGAVSKMRVFTIKVKKQLKHSVEVITLRIKAIYKDIEGLFLCTKLTDVSFIEEYQVALVPKKHLKTIEDYILSIVYVSL